MDFLATSFAQKSLFYVRTNERENYIPIFWACICVRCEPKGSMERCPPSEVSNESAASSGFTEPFRPFERINEW